MRKGIIALTKRWVIGNENETIQQLSHSLKCLEIEKDWKICLELEWDLSQTIHLWFKKRDKYRIKLESLILAQNERWWRALYMQVERGLRT